MNKKLIVALGLLVLAAAPSVRPAQGMGGGKEMDEAKDIDETRDVDEGMGWRNERRGGMGGEGMGARRDHAGQGEMRGMKEGRGGRGLMDETEVQAVIKKYDAAFAAKLAEFKTTAPQKYKMAVMMAGKMLAMSRLENDESLAGDTVKMLALEFNTRELAAKFTRAAEADKAGLKAELKLKVAELFDLRLKGQEFRIKRTEKDLAKLKSNLESRKANKARIVEERLGQVTGEAVGW